MKRKAKEATRLDPVNACALTHIGVLYKDEGRLSEAAQSYEKALKADPSFKPAAECLAIVLTDLGTSLKLTGKTEEEIQKYCEAIKVDIHYVPAYYNLEVVYSEMMRYDMVLGCYEKAALQRPMYAEAYCNMGMIYKNRGDLDSSRKVFDEMRERNVVTWNSLISGYANAGKSANVFYRMRCVETEVAADRFIISNTLTACAGFGDQQSGVQVHAFLVVAGFGCDSAVSNSLANMYFRCEDIRAAERSIDDIEEEEDCVILKLMMIKGYVFNELYEDALRSTHDRC